MYNLPVPLTFTSAEDAAEFAEAHWQVVKIVWARIAVIALVFIVLAAVFAGTLQMMAWCNVELSPIVCSLYLAGI